MELGYSRYKFISNILGEYNAKKISKEEGEQNKLLGELERTEKNYREMLHQLRNK